jgi:hypothetical protein
MGRLTKISRFELGHVHSMCANIVVTITEMRRTQLNNKKPSHTLVEHYKCISRSIDSS